jgi:phenylacetate-CoA ligase
MKFKISDYLYPVEIIKLFRFLKRSRDFSYERIVEHQNRKLRSIIHHAYQHVPYYRELFDKEGIVPEDIQTVNDLSAIPVLTKEIIKERYDDLIADNSEQFSPYQNQTSGSTGSPLKFLQDKNVNIARFTFFWRIWKMAGYQPYMKWAQIDGMFLGSEENLWKYNRMLNSLQISAFFLDHQNCKRILDKLSEFKPKIIRGYPTAIYTLAQFIDHTSYEINFSLKSIITYSENLLAEYRSTIEKSFDCNVFDVFTQWEGVCLISECEQHRLHQHMEFSKMELLDENNQPVGEKEKGEITATAFYNYSMPFIRYKTGDLATWSNTSCRCGMKHKVVENISGRKRDVLFDKNGYMVSFPNFQLNSIISYEKVEGLLQTQFVQNSLDKLEVYIVLRDSAISNRVEEELAKLVKIRLGDDMEIEFIQTDRIPKEKNGKIQLVKNKLIE